ncbi:MAG: hypothetical protein H8D78_03085 [Chloroflexi bacterium]|nr:hypothetical protein [Chloroflexota bacterium]
MTDEKYHIEIHDTQGVVIGDEAKMTHTFDDSRTVKVMFPTGAAGREPRCAALKEAISNTLDLIKQYENQRRLSSDPKEKKRCEQEIADLRNQLSDYQTEYTDLGCDLEESAKSPDTAVVGREPPGPPPEASAGTPSLPSSKLLYTNLALLFVALLATLFFINRCFSSTVLTIVVAALGVFGNLVAATKFQEPLRTQRAFWVCLVVTILSWTLAWLLPCPSDLRGKLYSTLTPTSTYTAPSCPIRIDEANKYPNGEASLDAVRGADPIRHDAIKITFVNPLPGSFSAWAVPLRICDATTSESLSFWVRGENGGERFEVGLKDSTTPSGQEPKIQQTASGDWQYVSIPLQGFQDLKKQDLSSLENFSLGFKYDLGNGTIYIDELTFGPP